MTPHHGHCLSSVPTSKNVLVVCVGSDASGFGVGAGVGVGVGSGDDMHPEKPIAAIAPANAMDLRNLRLPIFIVVLVLFILSHTGYKTSILQRFFLLVLLLS